MAIPLSPEEEAMIANYWGTGPATPAAPAIRQPTGFYHEPPPAPSPDDAIAQAYFAGQPKPAAPVPGLEGTIAAANGGAAAPMAPSAPPATGLPPVDSTTPGNLFGQPTGPAQAPGREPPPAAPPDIRQPSPIKREMISGRPVGAPSSAHAGAPANADPFGIRAAQKGLLGTYDAREQAVRQASAAEQDKAAVLGDHHAELARRRSEDASINQMETQYAAEHFDQKMTELERQLDDVATKKIDPKRMMKETPGLGFLAVIGGAIGGLYQGLSGGENPFMKELNIMIDRDIAAQERELDSAHKNASGKMGLLAQQRAIFQDSQQAKLAAQALYYQSAEDELTAEAARYDQPIYQARAEEAAQQIRAEKQSLMLKLAEQQRAISASAASSAFARDKEVRTMRNDLYDKVLAATGNPALAESEADRQVALLYGLRNQVGPRSATATPDPVSMVPKDQRTEAVKELQAHANKDKVIGSIGKSFQAWRDTSTLSPRQLDSTRSAIAGTIMANVPGIRSDVDFKEIVEPNLPARGDSDDTLRLKEQTIRNFVESKTVTPILDAHAPGWRNASLDEQRQQFGATKVGGR